jgi:TonB-linked SusC/RagA family outer membrane protein
MIRKSIMNNSSIKALSFVFLLLFSFCLKGQESITVTGTIVDINNQPISEISIGVEGSSDVPVVTEEDGKFQLTVENLSSWLIVQPVGAYNAKKVFLNGRTDIKIYLGDDDIPARHESILYPGENETKRNILASYYEVETRSFNSSPNQTLDQYFQGKVPGVHFTNHSGLPGTGGYTSIRGAKSMFTNNQPLYIVDGIPIENGGEVNSIAEGYAYNPLASLEPFDITEVIVLKDGLASTLYGSKGSNGVILIETLKPTETKTTIDFSLRTGINSFSQQLPQLNSGQYKTLANEILLTSGKYEEDLKLEHPGLYYTNNDPDFISAYKYSHNHNWQKEIFDLARYNDAYMSVKGGDAIARYGLSVGFLDHEGVLKGSSYDRFTARFVGTFNIFPWLRMYVSSSLTSSGSDFYESAIREQTSPILSSLFKSPQLEAYQWDTSIVRNDIGSGVFDIDTLFKQTNIIDTVDASGVSNPTAIIENAVTTNSSVRSLSSFRIEGDISSALKINSILGININSYSERVFWPNQGMGLYYNEEAHNVSKELSNKLNSIYNDNYISYTKQFNSVHDVSAVIGAKWQKSTVEEEWGISMNSPEDDSYSLLGTGATHLRMNGGISDRWNWMLSYASLAYAFKDKYLVNLNISGDISSRIGDEADVAKLAGIPVGLYYSAGLGWRLSNESFLKGISALDELKLRASFGVSGNDDIGNTSSFAYYSIAHYRNTTGLLPSGFANSAISAEKISQINVGVDVGLLGSRIYGTFDFFNSVTDDMLIYEKQSGYIGYETFPSNNASISNKGWELSLFARLLNYRDFTFDIGMNLSHHSNNVEIISDGETIKGLDHAEIITREGEEVNSFYGFQYLGVFSTAQEASIAGPDSTSIVSDKSIPFGAGDAIFADLSGPDEKPDGVINDYDKVVLGSPNPNYFGGISAGIRYKRWGLNMLWQFVYGNEVFNYVRYQNEKMSDLSNQSVAILNRWTQEEQLTEIPRALWNDPVGNNAFSSRWIEDGSYIRLKELTLSYTLKDQFITFKNLKVFISGRNLFTLTNYLGYDPEFSYSFDPLLQGIDYGSIPQGTQVLVGVKFGL